MAETTQTYGQPVQAPAAGQTVAIKAVPGQDIVLAAGFDQAEIRMEGGNVVFAFANGGQVVLDFTDLDYAQAPSVIMPDGSVLDMQEYLAALGEGEIEPAAGPEAGGADSGGVGEYRDDAGNLVEGVDKLGVLDPRDFTSISVEALDADNELAEALPTAGVVDAAADEDGLRMSEMTPFDGNDDRRIDAEDHPTPFAYAEGFLAYDFGGDGPAGTDPFVWSTVGLADKGVTSQGNVLEYEVVDGLTLNAYYLGRPDYLDDKPQVFDEESEFQGIPILVFSLEVTDPATGAYRFVLYRPLDHSNSALEDDIVYNFAFTVTDGTGDSALGGLNMIVDDDSPIWKAGKASVSGLVLEEALSFADGDTAEGSGDESLGASSDDEAWGYTGSLESLVSFGADGPGEFSLLSDTSGLPTLFSNGMQVQYVVEGGNMLTAYVDGHFSGEGNGAYGVEAVEDGGHRVVFTLQVNPDGSWYFDLQSQLDHVDAGTDSKNFDLITAGDGESVAGVPVIDFSSILRTTDGDGDELNGAPQGFFTIRVQDDVPLVEGTPTVSSELTLINHNASAGYNNSFGYYIKGDNGKPVEGLVIWDNVKAFPDGGKVTIDGYTPDQIGFFIIPDGDRLNSGLEAGAEVVFLPLESGGWQAYLKDASGAPVTPLLGQDAHVLFDVGSLNEDGLDHVQDKDAPDAPGNLNWEDIPTGGTWEDNDYNDVNITAEWKVTQTGKLGEFGADGGRVVIEGAEYGEGGLVVLGSNGAILTVDPETTDYTIESTFLHSYETPPPSDSFNFSLVDGDNDTVSDTLSIMLQQSGNDPV